MRGRWYRRHRRSTRLAPPTPVEDAATKTSVDAGRAPRYWADASGEPVLDKFGHPVEVHEMWGSLADAPRPKLSRARLFIVAMPERMGDSPTVIRQGIEQGMRWAFDNTEGVMVQGFESGIILQHRMLRDLCYWAEIGMTDENDAMSTRNRELLEDARSLLEGHIPSGLDAHTVLDALMQVVKETAESYDRLMGVASTAVNKAAHKAQADGLWCAYGFIENAKAGLP